MGIVFVIIGCIGVVVGIVGKEFYVGGDDAIASFDRKSSRWSGRVVFILAGLLLIAFGIKFLLVDR